MVLKLEKLFQEEGVHNLCRRSNGERISSDKIMHVGKIMTLIIDDQAFIDEELEKFVRVANSGRYQSVIPKGANAYVVSEFNERTTETTPNKAGMIYHTRYSVYALQFYQIKE